MAPPANRKKRSAASSGTSSKFVFVPVNIDETESDKSERLSRVRSHITTKFYQDLKSERSDAQSVQKPPRTRRLEPRKAATIVRSKSPQQRNNIKRRGLSDGQPIIGSINAAHSSAESRDNDLSDSSLKQHGKLGLTTYIHFETASRLSLFQPGLERLDPFDALPVKGDVRIDRTVQTWKASGQAPNLTPHTGLHFWGSFAGRQHSWHSSLLDEDDELLFYLRLMAAQFWCDKLLQRDESVEITFYRSQVLKGTRERLKNDPISLSTILAVSNLAINTGISGQWEHAHIHLEAVRRMIDLRGGFLTLPLPLRRVLLWNVFNTGAILQKGHQWPIEMIIDSDAPPLPKEFSARVSENETRTVSRCPPSSEMEYPVDMMHNLHILSVMDCEWPNLAAHGEVSNAFHRYMHGHYHALISPALVKGQTSGQLMLKSLIWASRLYIKSTLGYYGKHPIYAIWIVGMKRILEEGEGISMWSRSRGMNVLLWILFVSCVISEAIDPLEKWFIAQFRYAIAARGLKTKDELETVLRDFPWSSEYPEKSSQIWRKMTDTDRAATAASGDSSEENEVIPPFGYGEKRDVDIGSYSCIEPRPLATKKESYDLAARGGRN